MLETRKLCKIYRPKKGVPVRALDDVTLKFPQRGMVFLLGKSGSGKSTLLNLLGGLDRYDSGEIVIKGVSSKAFRQSDFDIYRNTYVGFIFQEYNVLEEFSVGANIALAIELQGRRATDEELNRILHEVELEGYGNRKPNELSGGQKQRVAIARALIKNPEIIMADEPTGALDSATGRTVLDLLKRLSADKLVIVVSHDREFAEQYADRIIELADGRVISDIEYTEAAAEASEACAEASQEEVAPAPGLVFGEGRVDIPLTYRLSEEDRLAINAYLEQLAAQGAKDPVTLQPVAEDGAAITSKTVTGRHSRPTDTASIPAEDGSTFRRIKSRLPLKNAFKIGAGALGYKKVRLCITILLSCVAFVLFGLADTFGAYDHIRTCSRSLTDSGITYASVTQQAQGEGGYYYSQYLSDQSIATLREDTGLAFHGVWDMSNSGMNSTFVSQYDSTLPELNCQMTDLFAKRFSGFAELDEAGLDELGYTLVAGRMPDGAKNEIAISTYVLESFLRGGYRAATETAEAPYEKITSAGDMLGKKLTMSGTDFTVVGVYDDGLDLERYLVLQDTDLLSADGGDLVLAYALAQEFEYAKQYSYASTALVGKGFIQRQMGALVEQGLTVYDYGIVYLTNSNGGAGTMYISPDNMLSTSLLGDRTVVWLDGQPRTLGEKEILISSDMLIYFTDASGYTLENIPMNEDEMKQAATWLYQSGLWRDLILENMSWSESVQIDEDWTIAGIVSNYEYISDPTVQYLNSFWVSDTLYDQIQTVLGDGVYSFAVAPMPEDQAAIRALVEYCYNEDAAVRYPMQNAVTFELDLFDEVLDVLADVFLYVGGFFAIFAALMLANFIGTSVSYKRQEIGILRAIGSRSNDVFRIFFAEAFIIAMINFVISATGTALITGAINSAVRDEVGILITLLQFGLRQIGLLMLISLAVAAIASFLPVRRIAAKRPIDAIRNR